MTVPAITMEPYRSVAAAAETMTEHRIHRIPVTHGKLIGVVSSGDLVRAFARPDDEVAAEVRDEVRYRLDVIGDSRQVDVSFDDGRVTLVDTVALRSTADSLIEVAGAVPGVLDVRSKVAWLRDDSKPDRNLYTPTDW